ncbi:MAG TPA: GFA family protein [Polyangiales bacterium]|nr:GFA family protein [Polyangiales bacterium]
MPETKTYTGSCHCGNVRYEVTTDLSKVIQCNCSLCSRAGYLLSFVPAAQFKLLKGEESLQDYRFNKHVIAHVFCKNCGVRSFAKGKDQSGNEMRAINVRCLEGVEPDTLSITKVNGRSA